LLIVGQRKISNKNIYHHLFIFLKSPVPIY